MAQKADVDGANNIIVQIEGDRNTVNLQGLAHLRRNPTVLQGGGAASSTWTAVGS